MIRRAFTMRLKPDSLAEYKRHHDHIWPELVEEIDKSGIASINTFQRGLDLFLISEISDLDAWDRLWTSEIHRRWAEVMRPLMHLTEDGIVETEEWTEVFYFQGPGNDQQPEIAAQTSEPQADTASESTTEQNFVGQNGAAHSAGEPTDARLATAGKRGGPKRGVAKQATAKPTETAANARRAGSNGKRAAVPKKAAAPKKPAASKRPAAPKKKVKKAKAATKQATPKKAAKKAPQKIAVKKSAKKAKRAGKKKVAR